MPISKQTLDFLAQNKFNNSREWFHAHKPEYQEYVRLCGKVFGGIAGCCSLQNI